MRTLCNFIGILALGACFFAFLIMALPVSIWDAARGEP